MDEYIKPICELDFITYMVDNPGTDKIEVSLLSEGIVEEFTRDELFESLCILISPLFAEFVHKVRLAHNYGEYYSQTSKHLKSLESITWEQAHELAHYKAMYAEYKCDKKRLRHELLDTYGFNKLHKATKLYEGLYRIPSSRLW